MAYERKCVVCGKEYEYCPHCARFKHLPVWMLAYCSDDCKETYMAINQYDFGHIDAKEALKIVDSYKVKIANKELAKSVKDMKKETKKKVETEEPENTEEAL